MFPWNIAKSAEAMFSRWAIKRVCKFLLKKKLGKFILGDVDINQLDVQLSAGTVQLSDLALNVDYLNQKFGAAAAVMLKEGSIGSLLVTLPWRGDGCRIEVDELELVIAPCGGNVSNDGSETCNSWQNNNYPANDDSREPETDAANSGGVGLTSVDVHEGVKTIAKMVKWLLSSFHMRIKKLIVAFDPYVVEEKNKRFSRPLVLRIAEVDCGTCISEDSHLMNEAKDNFLGLSRLTNFVKFEGAVLEFLQIDDVENQKSCVCASGTTFGEWLSGCSQSTAMTPVITGKNGGFSGHLKISIPWKNGSLDICKVDADACIQPLELRFQPSTVTCFIYLWHIFEDMGARTGGQMLYKGTESVYNNAAPNYTSSMPGPCSLNADKLLVEKDSTLVNCSSLIEEECKPEALLSESHVISDWVGRIQKDRSCAEPDFGASVDQFFECFDELRSSQSALGNSGMWNWTCSVFSAITAASNLASGSLHIPSVQQHVETNFKVTVAKLSLLFSFFDEEPVHSCRGRENQAKAGGCVHYLDVKFQDLLLVLQVCPEEMNFEATVQHIELDDHFSSENVEINPKLLSHSVRSQGDSIQKVQNAVQEALIPFCSSAEDAGTVNRRGYDVDVQPRMDAMNNCSCSTSHEGIYLDNVVKVALLKTSGISRCQVTVNTGSSGSFVLGPISITLKLPPFILWANFGLVDKVLDLLKEIGSCEMSNGRNFISKSVVSNKRSYSEGNERKSSCAHVSSVSTNESLRGYISLTNARIILMKGYSSVDQFIAFDFNSSPIFGDKKVEASEPASVNSLRKEYLLEKSRSLQLSWGDLAVYFITSDPGENGGTESSSKVKLKYSAHMIMSIGDGTSLLSTISMFWHDGALTGPWITKRAKLLATAENLNNRDRFMGKDYEFASATTGKEMEDFENHARQEIVLSSGFFLHALLSPIRINLGKVLYDSLIRLLHQLVDCLSWKASDTVNEGSSLSQGSILVECDSVGIAVTMEEIATAKTSVQRELPGSWQSFKLKIQKFELLSVSNIGGVKGSSFIWMAHGEGNLSGFVTGVPHEELLLISCSNSTMGRGDGEGSNVLSSRFSGTDIVHLWDLEDLHSCTSISVRCGTIVGNGGRVDWWDAISSFFSVPSPEEIEQASDNSLQKGGCEGSVPSRTSFVLNLIDVGVSYEPYLYDYAVHEGSNVETSFATASEAMDEQYFACLLAASSFRLSNASVSDSSVGEYNISVQDLGVLLCPVTGLKTVGGNYSVEHLSKVGYVKVAQEAHVEALLRTYSEEDPMWEVESSDLHVVLNTCYDTAFGLIRLGAQLQQLFAPDVEDTLVHLQTRWNTVQGANEDAEIKSVHGDAALSDPATRNTGIQSNPCMRNLMDEICEDAFQLVGISDSPGEYHDKDLHMLFNDTILCEPSNLSVSSGEDFAGCFPFTGSIPVVGLESNGTSSQHENIPEFIEEYFLSDPCPLSELSLRDQSSNDVLHCKSGSMGSGEVRIRNNGWYGNTSLRILENHLSEINNQTNPRQLEDCEASSSCTEPDDYGKIKGRVVLKNMNVVWRMYAGSDWSNFKKYSTSKRDSTVCLEISLSGTQIQYDIFPDGAICFSRLSLSIQDFCLKDNSKNAPWKLVLGYYHSKDRPRKSSSKALKMDLQSVRPDPLIPLEEYRLRVALLPLRLHLHQSQLDFLINFLGGQSASVNSSKNATQEMHEVGKGPTKPGNLRGCTIIEEALLPYFQKFDIWPVLVRVDYSPSHVDLAALRSGKYVELVNLLPWKGVELQLKHVHSVGVYGWSSVCETVLGEWLEDISQNQVRKLLKGLPPIRSLVAVGSGATKLVTLPVKNYRKDRRLVKGVQRGTIAFLRSISREAIGLGVHLAAGAHDILLQAEYILTSIPPTVESRTNMNVRSNQPKDARQGIKQAYKSISDGLGKSASALVRNPLKIYQRGDGVGSAFATAVQATPVAAVAPASAAARAMHYALLGVRNSLDPEHKKESLDKYLGST